MTQNRDVMETPEKFESSSPHHLFSSNAGHLGRVVATRKRGYSGDTRSVNPEDFARKVRREETERQRAHYEQTRIPPGFPPSFNSLDEYMDEIRSVRDAMRDSESTDIQRFVYVILTTTGRTPHIKVGYSNLPERRVSDLQVASPTRLLLVGQRRCPVPSFDRRVHGLIPENDRASGEWFRLSEWVRWILDVTGLVVIPDERARIPAALLGYRDPRLGLIPPCDLDIMDALEIGPGGA